LAFIVNDQVEQYAEEHTSPVGDLFERLAHETRAKTSAPQMMVGRIEGQFLARLVRLTGAKLILELGTFTGYSSISMASELPPDGRIITCDIDPDATAIARRYMDESGFGDRIEVRLGPALETIESLEGPFDLVFIDADKPSTAEYF
jgi:caffeoyl-CoA O-methyltransferase